MKATISIEKIASNLAAKTYPPRLAWVPRGLARVPSGWVAEIIGIYTSGKFKRKFLKGNKDYRHANSKNSRGVYEYFIIESDRIYDVCSPVSRKKEKRYFCTVNSVGDVLKISEDEARRFLSDAEKASRN